MKLLTTYIENASILNIYVFLAHKFRIVIVVREKHDSDFFQQQSGIEKTIKDIFSPTNNTTQNLN